MPCIYSLIHYPHLLRAYNVPSTRLFSSCLKKILIENVNPALNTLCVLPQILTASDSLGLTQLLGLLPFSSSQLFLQNQLCAWALLSSILFSLGPMPRLRHLPLLPHIHLDKTPCHRLDKPDFTHRVSWATSQKFGRVNSVGAHFSQWWWQKDFLFVRPSLQWTVLR